MKKTSSIIVFVIFIITTISINTAIATDPPLEFEDQVCDSGNIEHTISGPLNFRMQTFESGVAFITSFKVKLKRVQSSNTGTVLIGINCSNQEKARSFSYNSIPESPAWVSINFDSPIFWAPGYPGPKIVLIKNGGGDLIWYGDGQNPYTDGEASHDENFDFNFMTYGYNRIKFDVNNDGNNNGGSIYVDGYGYTEGAIRMGPGSHTIQTNMNSPFTFNKWVCSYNILVEDEYSSPTDITIDPKLMSDDGSLQGFIYLHCDDISPEKPSTPQGPGTVYRNVEQTFSTASIDKNGDSLSYIWYWGDGQSSYNPLENYNSGETVYKSYTWTEEGTFQVTVIAEDPGLLRSIESESLTVEVTNAKPNKPEKPSGPTNCLIGIEYTFKTKTQDLNNDKVKFGWDWNGDNSVDEWTREYLVPDIYREIKHTFSQIGIYNIKVIAEDETGAQSDFSSVLTVTVSEGGNQPPTEPTINGNTEGKVGTAYDYNFVTIDPDGDNVYYFIDWGDNTNSGWIGPYSSGIQITESHSWASQNTYIIKAKAKDIYENEGDWETLEITMPKTINPIFSNVLAKFLDNHPYISSLLRRVILRI